MIHEAECRIVLSPELHVKPTRVVDAGVCMEMFASIPCAAGTPETKIIIRGKHAAKVIGLLALLNKTDTELAKAARDSELAEEVEGLTEAEIGVWARQGAIDELRQLAERGKDED